MATINPYLNFDGNTGEAFNFYRSVFGGEFLVLQRFRDIPSDVPSPESEGNRVMHVSLPIGKGSILMGSDRPSAFGPGTKGDNFYISLQPETEEEAKEYFKSLSERGKVIMPLEKAFWGALFGMLTDKFGIQWMVNYDYNN
jgi:PhnB protein